MADSQFPGQGGTVDVAADGALTGDGSAATPLSVAVDGVTVVKVANVLTAPGGGGGTIGGTLGNTDNVVPRSDGTGGATLQASAMVISDAGVVTGVTMSGAALTDGTVTLAKMANLAQDQFIGRMTASTGVPQTATITAAARTVLDDTTVAAMVDTLGGASSTGTGGIARATSPSFTTPALGTPSAAVLTNATGLVTAGLVDNAVTNAKLATMATGTVKANVTGGTAVPTDVTYSALATAMSIVTFTDPNQDAVVGWDDTDSAIVAFLIGSGLAYDHATHTLSASGGGGSIGGSTGSTDNAVIRANGTGGSTVQPSAMIVDDAGAVTGVTLAVGLVSGLGTGVATFLATPSSSNLAAAVTGETGTGALVFGTSPSFTTPALGTPATGTLNLPFVVPLCMAAAQGATASLAGNTPASGAATAAVAATTVPPLGVASFSGSASNEIHFHFPLPQDWLAASAFDVYLTWRAASTSGNVVWQVATLFVGDAVVYNTAYNTASTVTDAAKGTTLQSNTTSIASVTASGTTTPAAGKEMFIKILRDGGVGSDTMSGAAELISAQVVGRRAVVING